MNDKMLQEVKDFMTPFGTVGQLIEETPKEVISKVFEDLLYQTGHHGRTVLIGDGKMQVMMAYMQNFFWTCLSKNAHSSPYYLTTPTSPDKNNA